MILEIHPCFKFWVSLKLCSKISPSQWFFIIISNPEILSFFFIYSTWFYVLRDLHGSSKYQLYGAAAVLGMGSSTLLIDSLAMISEMIGKNTVSDQFALFEEGFRSPFIRPITLFITLLQALSENSPYWRQIFYFKQQKLRNLLY